MTIKKSVVLSILLLLGSVQKSSAAFDFSSCGGGFVGATILTVGIQKLIYTFWWTTESEFNNLVLEAKKDPANTEHDNKELDKFETKIKAIESKDQKDYVMRRVVECTKNAKINAKLAEKCMHFELKAEEEELLIRAQYGTK